ncbi:MAG TPA: oxygenase MpaB family protein [Marmoricola sp.]|nr:oxygenase MpaB family protein [Marmoricola sp.]
MTALHERHTVSAEPFDFNKVADLYGMAGMSAAGANIVMQLAVPGVGHGVARSVVESGALFRHPIKRARTTMTYLAVTLLGTDEERAAYREAVNGSHRQVHSEPGAAVKYNAFDPQLQLWVAACLYKGLADNMAWLDPVLYEREKESMYQSSAILGTTLQMRPEMWPASLDAFQEYWDGVVATRVSMDETVRDYLNDFLDVRYLPRPFSSLLGPLHRWLSIGWLPREFRELMDMTWTARDQQRFDRLHRWVRRINALTPTPIRRLGITMYLYDFRLRRRFGLRLV